MDFEVLPQANLHPTRGYSHAVRIGNLLFVSGQVARNRQGETVGKGDIRAQTRQVYENLKAVLEAAGSGLDLVGKLTIFTTSIDHRPAIAEVRDTFFKDIGHYPASTFLVISSLADPDFLIEIEAVAAIR